MSVTFLTNEDKALIDKRVDALSEEIAKIGKSVIKGKVVAVLGDSISSINYTTPNYWQIIAEKTGCEFLNYGVSSSCIAAGTGATVQSFVERAASMDSAADAVLIMGGTNDVGYNVLIGAWNSTDNTTLYGAINSLIDTLRTKYKGKPIIFCTPMKRATDVDDGFPMTMEDLKTTSAGTAIKMQTLVLAIKAKCARHGIPVVDIADSSGIGANCSEYFRDGDSLHPSMLGEIRIANLVQAELEKQFRNALQSPEDENPEDKPGTSVTYVPNIDGGIQVGDGAQLVVNNLYRTDYIALDGYARITATYRLSSNAYALAFYDSNKTLLPNVSVAGVGLDSDNNVDMGIPVGAAYCIFSHYAGNQHQWAGSITLHKA